MKRANKKVEDTSKSHTHISLANQKMIQLIEKSETNGMNTQSQKTKKKNNLFYNIYIKQRRKRYKLIKKS